MALNKAIFIVSMMMNAVPIRDKSHIKFEDTDKRRAERAFSEPAKKSPNYDDLIFDFQSLVFLLENNPDLLMDLSIEQQRFKQLFSAEEMRSDFYVNQVQPVLSSSGLNNGQVNTEILRDALDDRLFFGLINLTNSYFYHLEKTDQSLKIMYEKLRQTAKELYPDEGFIEFKLGVSD